MNKIGRIKSWYIDPDDNRLTYTQHNILFVNFLTERNIIQSDTTQSNLTITTLPSKLALLNLPGKLIMLVSQTFMVVSTTLMLLYERIRRFRFLQRRPDA